MSDALNLALTITAADMFSGVLRHFRDRITGAGAAAKAVRKDYDLMTQSINRGIKAVAATAYIAAKLRPAVAAAGELQGEMIGVRAELSGANTDAAELAKQLVQVRKTAFDVQAVTPFDIGQIVALEKELIKAGASVQDVIGEKGAAAAAAALATFEKMEPVLAGTALISIGTPFKIAADGYADLADQISRAASASQVGAADIADSARYAAGPLAGLNRSSTEMFALVAVLAQVGVVGSMAGTSLKNFFLEAAKQKSLTDANGNLKSTAEIVEVLRKKTAGMGDAKKSSLLTKVFGEQGLPVALALLNDGKGSLEYIVQSMREAAPLSEKLRQEMEGFNRQMDSLTGTSRSTLAILFEPALKPLTELIAKTNEWAAALGKAAMENDGLGKGVTYGAGGLVAGGLAYGLAKFAQGGGAGLRVMRGLKGLGGVAGGVAAGAAVQAATGVTPVFVTNWPGTASMLTGGMGGTAAGVAAGAAGPAVFSKMRTMLALLGGTALSKLPMYGAGAMATGGAGALAAGGLGYGIGTLIHNAIAGSAVDNKIGEAMARIAAFFGSDNASAALKGNIKIEVDDKRVRVKQINSGNPNVDYEVESGLTMGMP